MSFAAGASLKTVQTDCCRYQNQMKESSSDQAAANISMLWQSALNLSDKCDNPEDLSGDVIPNLATFSESVTLESGKVMLRYCQSYLCAIFGNYERGASMALVDEGRFKKAGPGICINMHETFTRGLCLFCMARKSKMPKYKRAGKRVLSTIRRWVKEENPNVLHYEQLSKQNSVH